MVPTLQDNLRMDGSAAHSLAAATAGAQASRYAELRILDPLALPDWDRLVLRLPGYSPFHGTAWARVLEDTYDYKPCYFGLVQEGELRAVLPTMEVNSWLTGRRGVSLPFTDTCELLAFDAAAESQLLDAAIAHGRSRKWKYWEGRNAFRPRPEPQQFSLADSPLPITDNPATDLLTHRRAAASASYYTHTLDLRGNEDQLFASFDSSVRRATRKAEKSGVTVEKLQTIAAVREFYELHCLTRKKHGVPPQPFDFFANLHRHVLSQNQGFVMVARAGGQPIAASLFIHFGARAIYKFGASDERFQALRGPNVVMWNAIQWYVRAGFDQLHFGRTDMHQDGLRRFKLGWGTTEQTIHYCRYSFKRSRFFERHERTGRSPDLQTVGSSGQEKVGISNLLVRLLPIWASRAIGSLIYRHVA